MTLTDELQYIGRSTPVGCGAGYNYYLLVFAAAVPKPELGGHRVKIRTLLACSADASFYGFATSASASLGDISLYGWSRRQLPGQYWGSSEAITVDGILYPRWTELVCGEALIPGSLAGTELTLRGDWVMESALDRGWFPNTGERAVFEFPVTLSPAPGQTIVTLSRKLVLANYNQRLQVTAKSPVPGASFRLDALMRGNRMIQARTFQEKVELMLDPGDWIPMIPFAADTTGLSDSEAPLLRITTLDSDGNILEEQDVRFDFAVPESCGPTISGMNMYPVSLSASPFDGMYIQGITKVQVRGNIYGQYGAYIASQTITVEGKTRNLSDNLTSDYLSGWGTVKVSFTAVDSRGFSRTWEEDIYVLPYMRPVLVLEHYCRCDEDGYPAEDGRYLYLSARGSSTTMNLTENPCCMELRWRQEGGVYGDWQPLTEMVSQETEVDGKLENVRMDPALGCTVQLRCRDAVGGCTITEFTVAPEEVYMHRTPRGLGIGKYVEEQDLVDCRWNLWLRGTLRLGEEGTTLQEYIRKIVEEYNGNL